MDNTPEIMADIDVVPLIRVMRDQRVIPDADLATIYGVVTKNLNRAVKRNAKRFPREFVFQLEPDEVAALRCQIGTLKTGRGQPKKYAPYADAAQTRNRLPHQRRLHSVPRQKTTPREF
jgi:hypothetical protein